MWIMTFQTVTNQWVSNILRCNSVQIAARTRVGTFLPVRCAFSVFPGRTERSKHFMCDIMNEGDFKALTV